MSVLWVGPSTQCEHSLGINECPICEALRESCREDVQFDRQEEMRESWRDGFDERTA